MEDLHALQVVRGMKVTIINSRSTPPRKVEGLLATLFRESEHVHEDDDIATRVTRTNVYRSVRQIFMYQSLLQKYIKLQYIN